jgi:type VI secretion system secreted protein VgrG
VAVLVTPWSAAGAASVELATATAYSVLAGSTVTNTGPSVLNANVGVSPGTDITGFPPGTVVTGVMDSANAVSLQGQADLTAAYIDAAGRPITGTEPADLANLNLPPGVYEGPAHGALSLTGPLFLDGGGDFGAVFIFQTDSTLITASSSTVNLINGAQECNVFWQVGSSATLGTDSVFAGNIMALTSISVQTGVTVHGRALARNGAVTLDNDVFTAPTCALAGPTTTTETPTTEAGSTDTTAETTQTATPGIRLPVTGAPVKAPLLLAGTFLAFGVAAVYLARRNSASEG